MFCTCTKCLVVGVVERRNKCTGFFFAGVVYLLFNYMCTFCVVCCAVCLVAGCDCEFVSATSTVSLSVVLSCTAIVHRYFACPTCPNSPANVVRFSWRWVKSTPPNFCAVPCWLDCGAWGCAARLYLLFFSLCSFVS